MAQKQFIEMKYILLIIVVIMAMSCKQIEGPSLANTEYPITITDITLKDGNTSRSMSFTSNNGVFFTVNSNEVVDYLIKHKRIGDVIETPMVETTGVIEYEEDEEVNPFNMK